MTKSKQPLDSELNVRALAGLSAILVVVVAVAFVLMWWLSQWMLDERIAADPPPPRLPEARVPHEPPGPRLQAEPFADLTALRAQEERILTTYAWVDEAAGIARVPVDRAMDLLVEEGFEDLGD